MELALRRDRARGGCTEEFRRACERLRLRPRPLAVAPAAAGPGTA